MRFVFTARSAWMIVLAILLAAVDVRAQGFNVMSGRNHPELIWQVAETEHFRIMYPDRIAGIEAEAAAVAEAAYVALARNLEVTFDRKIDIYLSDEDEITNGFAVPIGTGYTNIWVHVPEFARMMTGPEKWLRSVIAHELAHIFHYRKVIERPRWMSFLFANPLPSFWTEGIAQYETENWTAQRGDRWLRAAVLDDRLSYADGRSLWNGRLRYAVGNSQVRYLTDRYGDSTLTAILSHRTPVLFGLARVHDFGPAFRQVVGHSYREFYDDWRRHVNIYYNYAAAQLENADSLGGKPLKLPGQYYFDVAYSPDTAHVAVLALTALERPIQRLYVVTRATRETRILAEGSLYGPVAWSPDGRMLAYTRLHRGRHGSLLRDIYVVNRDGSGRRRITDDRRAGSPAFSPDGQMLAFTAADNGTENIYIRYLDSGDERALTDFDGDVQVSSLRWSPSGREILFDRFRPDGRRDLAVIDVQSSEIESVTPGKHDDRDPVWSPDGRKVAYVSLRDDVPNVFVFDRETRRNERVTRLATGAEVRDWLPPDSLHADGTLVIVSMVSKSGDEAYRIDASRRVSTKPVAVPAPYSSWTTHRPPAVVPAAVSTSDDLIHERYRYVSTRNIRHVTSLAFPYVRIGRDLGLGADWGIAGFTAWIEPLGKHVIVAGGGLSARDPIGESYVLASYVNNQWRPSISVSGYRLPGSAQVYGSDLLVEAFAGGHVGVHWPLDWWDVPYTSETFDARLRVVDVEALTPDEFDASSGLPPPDEGQQADLRATFAWRKQRPYWNSLIHPLDGLGLRARVTVAARVLGTDSEFVRGDLSAFGVFPVVGPQRLFLYGRAQAQAGESFAQDFVGLSRHDAVRVELPSEVPLLLGETERVRGFRDYALGDRMLFGTAEYRFPVSRSLRTSVLGLVSFGSVAGAIFADAGLVWSDGDFGGGVHRVGLGFELKNAVEIAGLFRIAHALGVAQPASELGWDADYDLYYRIRTSLPF